MSFRKVAPVPLPLGVSAIFQPVPTGCPNVQNIKMFFSYHYNVSNTTDTISYNDQQMHTIISQIITLLHVSTLSCHPQTACN